MKKSTKQYINLKRFSNNSGVALLMVLTSIALLTFIMADFTFETKINKLKIQNHQDKLQAKLNAVAGMKFALAKMKLYKEARNILEKNAGLKDIFDADKLQSIITLPFFFPIPISKKANIIQKTAVEEFIKNTLLVGKLSVTITPVAGFLNPNNLRLKKIKTNSNSNEENRPESESESESEQGDSPQIYIEKQLIKTLKDSMDKKKEEDEEFENLYGDLDPELLIKELKYYVCEKESFQDDRKSEIETIYITNDITPKHAPITSLTELYLLQGWNDAIVDLIKDKLTVHEISIIPINKINQSQLKILFPSITAEQSTEFFKYRDGSQKTSEDEEESDPHRFKSEQDFMNLVVGKLHIVDENSYKNRIKEFANAGLKIGVAGKLFNVVSRGEYERATYTINAYIDLPIKPLPLAKPTPTPSSEEELSSESENKPEDENKSEKDSKDEEEEEEEKKPPEELLEPRIVEIIVE